MTDSAASWFRGRVLAWSLSHPRAFPWRQTTDPFAVLIAEIMLRRTRAEQVVPVYDRFIARFPEPRILAAASEHDVEAIVRPLGLAWRVPAFRRLAAVLVTEYGGSVPSEYNELIRLPGVGDYVAAAVRAFAFNLPTVVADTNTVRVAARYFGFRYHADSRRNRSVRAQVAQLLDDHRAHDSSRALLDFASLICRAQDPLCGECPVASRCAYHRSQILCEVEGSREFKRDRHLPSTGEVDASAGSGAHQR
jgi:A/G-specific adenine glycosylase